VRRRALDRLEVGEPAAHDCCRAGRAAQHARCFHLRLSVFICDDKRWEDAMRDGRRVIDTDTHQMEPPGMWAQYIDASFKARAPATPQGEARAIQAMAVEGESLTAEGKYPFSTPDFLAALLRGMQRFERARGAGFNAASRLADMDEHGVDTQVLYPTVGGQLLGREFHDTELLAACCRAYNTWTAEYCSAAPQRLRWAAMLPLQDVTRRRQARRAAADGAAALRAGPNPSSAATSILRDHDPLWAAIRP
jgi:predicted TIM-barrel fold metal-dependent hydrolase